MVVMDPEGRRQAERADVHIHMKNMYFHVYVKGDCPIHSMDNSTDRASH